MTQLSYRLYGEKGKRTMTTDLKYYACGNREIPMYPEDAEQLRIILQTEYLTRIIGEFIDQHIDEFNFPSDKSRDEFINELVRVNDDLISYDSIYFEETLQENIFDRAELYDLLR